MNWYKDNKDDWKSVIETVAREISRSDRIKSGRSPSAVNDIDLSEILNHIVNNNYFRDDYNDLTTKLLFESYSYEKAIHNGIGRVVQMKLF